MRILSILAIVILSTYQVHSQTAAKTKLGLIFAIGNYPTQKTGWDTISSNNDIPLIKNTLLKQGFENSNINVITDEKATLDGIKQGFAELIKKAKTGDIVVIHFSCHGIQITADEESKSIDGQDECIVTYNALNQKKWDKKDYDFLVSNYLRGHVIGNYLKQLRSKLGKNGDVLVLMDCCHSSGNTRGGKIAKVRGGQAPIIKPGADVSKHRNSDSSIIARSISNSRGDMTNLASIEVISASRPEELCYEAHDDVTKQECGSLSYATAKAFQKLEAGTSYRTLFAKIQEIMNVSVPEQHPMLEGDGVDRKLFGGDFVFQKPFFTVNKIISNNELQINAGLMAGLDVGATVSIFPSGTVDTLKAKPIANGVVTAAQLFSSNLKLSKNIAEKQEVKLWAFVAANVYKIDSVTVKILMDKSTGSTVFSKDAYDAILSNLKSSPLARLGENPDLLIEKGEGNEKDKVKIAANGLVFTTVDAESDKTRLSEIIQTYSQYKFIQLLNVKDNNCKLEVKFVPVVNNKPNMKKMNSKMVNGTYEFYDGDTVAIYVKNIGPKDVFVNIIDLQPNGKINPILPNKENGYIPSELLIEKGKGHYFFPDKDKTLVMRKPFGTEVFKIFASETEIDMETIAASNGVIQRAVSRGGGNLSPMELLLKNSFNGNSRGGETSSNANGTISGIVFRIKPPKN